MHPSVMSHLQKRGDILLNIVVNVEENRNIVRQLHNRTMQVHTAERQSVYRHERCEI